MGEAGNQSGADGVNGGRNDDRNCRGRIPQRKRCGCRAGDDHVSLESNHLGRKLLKSLCSALRVTALNDDVLSLNIAEFPQWLEQGSVSCIVWGMCDEANTPHSCCLLRPGREWRRGRRSAEQRDELAALHSITPSASCWRCKGTSRPSALALFRLMTSSNLVGSSIGISDALLPFNSLLTTEPARRHTS